MDANADICEIAEASVSVCSDTCITENKNRSEVLFSHQVSDKGEAILFFRRIEHLIFPSLSGTDKFAIGRRQSDSAFGRNEIGIAEKNTASVFTGESLQEDRLSFEKDAIV